VTIQTSLHGQLLGLTKLGSLQCPGGFTSGADNYNLHSLADPSRVTFFDDFLGDVVADQWNFTEGTDSGTSDGAISELVNGVFLLTPGDSAGSVAADGAQLNSALNWKANQGNLVFQARVKLAAITSVSCFIGLTDTKSLEQPIHSASSADTITTNATDAVGFFFDTNMTTDNWWFAGVANDVDATHQNMGVAPVADTYETFRIEITSDGKAQAFRNGVSVGTLMSGALTATVALTPVFIVRPLSAAAGKTMSVDYSYVSANRV
jgi:hypothetical protein